MSGLLSSSSSSPMRTPSSSSFILSRKFSLESRSVRSETTNNQSQSLLFLFFFVVLVPRYCQVRFVKIVHHGRSSERGHERHAERFQWGHVSTTVLFVVSRLLFSDTSQKLLLLLLLCVISSIILMEKSLQKSKICVFLQKQI